MKSPFDIVKKKNIHLRKYLQGPLPEPEVSADDAWAEMNGMLDGKSSGSKGNNTLKIIAALISLTGIILVVWLLYPKSGDERKITELSNVKSSGRDRSAQHGLAKTAAGNAGKKIQQSGTNENAENDAGSLPQINDGKETKLNGGGAARPGFESGKPAISRARNGKADGDISKDVAGREEGGKGGMGGRGVGRMEEGGEAFLVAKTFESEKAAAAGKAVGIANTADSRWAGDMHLLQPKSFRFSALGNTIRVNSQAANPGEQVKTEKLLNPFQSFLSTLHFGLEWNAASSFRNTQYIFAGADSVSRPYLLAIPGLWLNKGVGKNQSVTLSLLAHQPYFGGFKQIRQDSIPGNDSTLSYRQTKLVKAAGFNVSVQYNYHFSPLGMLSAGFGYSALRSALFREDFQNHASEVYSGPLVSVRKKEIGEFIHTSLFAFKTGLTFTPGRFQLGVNLVIPLTDLSLTQTSLRTLNGQVLLRYRIK
ncbi:hypothetical protein [Dyadobacter bucti]|uniref:hypothetical protein n=1 Tax=Dyadobacter bucti TaxID=2572203 RepID=UPI003F6EDCB5